MSETRHRNQGLAVFGMVVMLMLPQGFGISIRLLGLQKNK